MGAPVAFGLRGGGGGSRPPGDPAPGTRAEGSPAAFAASEGAPVSRAGGPSGGASITGGGLRLTDSGAAAGSEPSTRGTPGAVGLAAGLNASERRPVPAVGPSLGSIAS